MGPQRLRSENCMTTFEQLYGRAALLTAEASGRVNLIGEHTDYNGGFVLPTAIPQRTRVELAPREDAVVRVWSSATQEQLEFRLGAEQPGRGWLDYMQGLTSQLAKEGHQL